VPVYAINAGAEEVMSVEIVFFAAIVLKKKMLWRPLLIFF
jgi:hypothetical protein